MILHSRDWRWIAVVLHPTAGICMCPWRTWVGNWHRVFSPALQELTVAFCVRGFLQAWVYMLWLCWNVSIPRASHSHCASLWKQLGKGQQPCVARRRQHPHSLGVCSCGRSSQSQMINEQAGWVWGAELRVPCRAGYGDPPGRGGLLHYGRESTGAGSQSWLHRRQLLLVVLMF